MPEQPVPGERTGEREALAAVARARAARSAAAAGSDGSPTAQARSDDADDAPDPDGSAAGGLHALGSDTVRFLREAETAVQRLAQLALAEAQLSYGAMRTAFLAGILRNILAGFAVFTIALAGVIALADWLDSWPLALLALGIASGVGAFVAAAIHSRAWGLVGLPHTRALWRRWLDREDAESGHGQDR